MDRLRAELFAEPDRTDLGQTALDLAAEVGVRLDAVDEQDVVSLQSGGAGVHRYLVDGADLLNIHARNHRHADRLASDAIAGKQVPLTFGRGTAVAAHRRHDERIAAGFTDGITARAQYGRHVGHPAAAGGDGDTVVECDAIHDRLQLGANSGRNLLDGKLGRFVRGVDPLAGVQQRKLEPNVRAQFGREHRDSHRPYRSRTPRRRPIRPKGPLPAGDLHLVAGSEPIQRHRCRPRLFQRAERLSRVRFEVLGEA